MNKHAKIQLLECLINALGKEFSPAEIAIAFHNTLCHGRLHNISTGGISEKHLGKVIGSAEKLIKVLHKAEK